MQPYIDVLQQLWIMEPVRPWLPTMNVGTRLGAAPKHQLADPALAARLLKLDSAGLLGQRGTTSPSPRDGAILGNLFESLVTLSVRVYAQAAEASVMHMRTREPNEREIDLIVQRQDGRVLAIEVKLARTI